MRTATRLAVTWRDPTVAMAAGGQWLHRSARPCGALRLRTACPLPTASLRVRSPPPVRDPSAAGKSVRELMQTHGVPFCETHERPVELRDLEAAAGLRVVVTIRDGVDRLLSALAFLHYHYNPTAPFRHAEAAMRENRKRVRRGHQLARGAVDFSLAEVLRCFPNAPQLARALVGGGDGAAPSEERARCGAIGAQLVDRPTALGLEDSHVERGYLFYFSDSRVMRRLAGMDVFAVRVPSLAEDAPALLSWARRGLPPATPYAAPAARANAEDDALGAAGAHRPPLPALKLPHSHSSAELYRNLTSGADWTLDEELASALARRLDAEYEIIARLLCVSTNGRRSLPAVLGRMRLVSCADKPGRLSALARWQWLNGRL